VLAGEFAIVNKHLLRDLIERGLWTPAVRLMIMADKGSVQRIEAIPQDLKDLYKTVWEIKQKVMIDMAADRGAFICQSQSLNIHIAEPSIAKLTSMHFYAWKAGLKTGMYYLRTRPKADAIQFTVDQLALAESRNQDVVKGAFEQLALGGAPAPAASAAAPGAKAAVAPLTPMSPAAGAAAFFGAGAGAGAGAESGASSPAATGSVDSSTRSSPVDGGDSETDGTLSADEGENGGLAAVKGDLKAKLALAGAAAPGASPLKGGAGDAPGKEALAEQRRADAEERKRAIRAALANGTYDDGSKDQCLSCGS